jgi:hypothetical protein
MTARNIEIINNNDMKILSLLALPAVPCHGDGTVLTPKQLPPHPLPSLHVSALSSSAGEGGEMMMKTMTIQEAMMTSMMSDPATQHTTTSHSRQGVEEAATKTTMKKSTMAV